MNLFNETLSDLHLLKHPFYQAWMEGKITNEQLKEYARQYYKHVSAFPRYISAIHSQCENEEARKLLLENLNDEEGVTHGLPHPEMWMRFAEGLGNTREEVKSAEAKAAIENVMNTFFKYARKSYHEGLGALYAYEAQVPEVAHSKIEGLKEKYNIHDKNTLLFFEVHKSADVEHRQVVEKLLNSLPEKEKQEAMMAARETAKALWDFLTEVYACECAS